MTVIAPLPSSAGPPRGAARRRGRSVISRRNAGTTVAGSGRSEMSSSGIASWCICVCRSPGSTAHTLIDGSSSARIAEAWSRRPSRRRSRPASYASIARPKRCSPPRRRAAAAAAGPAGQGDRGQDVDFEGVQQLREREVGQRRGRRAAELRRVVDQQAAPPRSRPPRRGRRGGCRRTTLPGSRRRASASPARSRPRPVCSPVRASMTSCQPSAASALASSSPRPCEAPVMTATGRASEDSVSCSCLKTRCPALRRIGLETGLTPRHWTRTNDLRCDCPGPDAPCGETTPAESRPIVPRTRAFGRTAPAEQPPDPYRWG